MKENKEIADSYNEKLKDIIQAIESHTLSEKTNNEIDIIQTRKETTIDPKTKKPLENKEILDITFLVILLTHLTSTASLKDSRELIAKIKETYKDQKGFKPLLTFLENIDTILIESFNTLETDKTTISFKQLLDMTKEKTKEAYTQTDILTTLIPIKPLSHTLATDSLTRELNKMYSKQPINIEEVKGKYKEKKGLKPLQYEIAVTLINEDLTTDKVLTYFDKIILETMYTLAMAGNKYIDLAMVKQHITQNDTYKKTMLDKEIKDSIHKLSTTYLTIDIAKEINERFTKEKFTSEELVLLKTKTYLLPLQSITMRKGGIEKEAYYFITTPAYFIYIKKVGQLASINTLYLGIGRGQNLTYSNTPNNICIRYYLNYQIQTIKYKKENNQKWTNKILYDSLFKETEILDSDLSEKTKSITTQRFRDVIKKHLNYLKKNKEIKDFREYGEKNKDVKKGIQALGVEIII